jgi:hypothetical protein
MTKQNQIFKKDVVSGPASSTDGNFVSFDGVDGKTAKDSGKSASDFADATHGSSHISTGGDAIADAVAAGASGLMSGTDKTKLDGIAESANNYSLPTASADTLGGVKIGSGVDITDGVISVTVGESMAYKGVIDCSENPNYPAADKGDLYKVSVAGKIGGASGPSVEVGDTMYCDADSTASGDHATVGSHWGIVQVNIDGAVTGPASSTDNTIARFDSTTGKIIQGSLATIDDSGSINVPSGQSFKVDGTALPTAADIISWTEVTSGSQALAANAGYIANYATLVTLTLPATCAVGKIIRVVGYGEGGWKIAQNAGQQINFGGTLTTSGTDGHMDSSNRYESVELICVVANTTFLVVTASGSPDLT